MPRFKHYNYDQDAMVVINYQEQLQPGTFEHAVHYLIEHKLDLSVFHPKYCNEDTGRLAYDPAEDHPVRLLQGNHLQPRDAVVLRDQHHLQGAVLRYSSALHRNWRYGSGLNQVTESPWYVIRMPGGVGGGGP